MVWRVALIEHFPPLSKGTPPDGSRMPPGIMLTVNTMQQSVIRAIECAASDNGIVLERIGHLDEPGAPGTPGPSGGPE